VRALDPINVDSVEIAPISLRTNFAWTVAGNLVYGASQWAVLSLIAKLGDSEMLGQYALAVAVAGPVAMLSHLNLRAVLATDMARRQPFGDYLAVRLATTAAALLATAAIALVSGYPWLVSGAIVLAGVCLGLENVSDTYYGLMQRRERLEEVARAMIARGALSIAALGVALWLTRNLVWAIAALALARVAVLLIYERPRGSAGESLERTGLTAQLAIFRTALPLGVVLMLASLTLNVPRYAIEHFQGTRELGAFAAVASFLTAGAVVVGALGQSAMPRLARQFSERDLAGFRRLALKLIALSVALGAVGVLGAALVGRFVLSVAYRPEYGSYNGLFVAVMGAGVLRYAAIMLGFVLTSVRSFGPQVPLLAAATLASGLASWMLVPVIGLGGAAAAIVLAACVQIAGSGLILRRAMSQA
jgi:O-antigen/teichoic acid export membrane protein